MKEKVAYLKGLSEGLGVDAGSNEGRIILEILNVLDDVVDELEYLNAEVDYSLEYCEALDDDLADLEEDVDFLFEELDDEYDDYEDYDDYDDYDELDFIDDFEDEDYDFEDTQEEFPQVSEKKEDEK